MPDVMPALTQRACPPGGACDFTGFFAAPDRGPTFARLFALNDFQVELDVSSCMLVANSLGQLGGIAMRWWLKQFFFPSSENQYRVLFLGSIFPVLPAAPPGRSNCPPDKRVVNPLASAKLSAARVIESPVPAECYFPCGTHGFAFPKPHVDSTAAAMEPASEVDATLFSFPVTPPFGRESGTMAWWQFQFAAKDPQSRRAAPYFSRGKLTDCRHAVLS